jgi:hypothetical protein
MPFPGDRCYYYLNIFAEKFGENIGVFAETTASFFTKKLIKTLVFEKNANILPKIGKNRRKL